MLACPILKLLKGQMVLDDLFRRVVAGDIIHDNVGASVSEREVNGQDPVQPA